MLDYLNQEDKKNEAYRFNLFLTQSCVTLYDETDSIWNEILNKVKIADYLREIPEYSKIPFESPFLRGDIKGAETGLPDIIFKNKNYVLGIECFEFDSSKRTKKGSQMRRDEMTANAKLDKEIRLPYSQRSKIEVCVPTIFSYTDYINSLFEGFKSHASKIDKYKTALKCKYPSKDVLFAFFVEDSTKLGNYISSQHEMKSMNPLFVKEFIDLISQYSGIDYLITAYVDDFYVPNTYIQKIDSDNLVKLLKNSYTSQYDFCAFKYKMQVNLSPHNS